LIFKPLALPVVLDPKLVSADVPTLNPPLCGEFKATRFAGGRLLCIHTYLLSSSELDWRAA